MNPLLTHHVDSTMITAFRGCPRKFYHEFVLGLRPVGTKIDLVAGAALAKGLEVFYREVHEAKRSTSEALSAAFTSFTNEWGDTPHDNVGKSPKSHDRVWEALANYIVTYPPHTDHVQPYRDETGKATYEFSFAIPLEFEGFPLHPDGNPFIYCGRFDLLGVYQGRPCVRDEKTTAYAGETWADQWNLRNQFMGYVWACQHYGIDLETVVVRGIVIQKTQIKQLEAIKIFPKYLIERWFEQLKSDLNRLVNCWNANYFDYNFADACSQYGGCVYQNFCSDKDPWYSDPRYQILRWNPLTRTNEKE